MSRNTLRIVFFAVVLLSSLFLVNSFLAYESNGASELREQSRLPDEAREPIVPPAENATVLTTQNTGNVDGALVAFAPDGRLLYYNDTYSDYHDVDPVAAERSTVVYLATMMLSQSCGDGNGCKVSVVERLDLSTGETERLYTYRHHAVGGTTSWHDADVGGDHHLLVADIGLDRVFVVNTTTDVIEYTWRAQSDYPERGGGAYPTDWTHLNDVESLPDGRAMVSLRNQDQIVFLNRSGVVPGWTLGCEDCHDTLFEQHNPDYIPAAEGGPAVVVADSENNRIVEYERVDGEWEQTWVWRDSELRWPRDADRLPNGHTLITDSNGHRVVEVDRDGNVTWAVNLELKIYDAERLGTGDESAGGPSARAADLTSRRPAESDGDSSRSLPARVWKTVRQLLPVPVLNGLFFVLPAWVSTADLPPIMMIGLVGLGWTTLEIKWLPLSVDLHRPVSIRWRRNRD